MTDRRLAISPDLPLPLDTVTSTMIVYGGKGMGKRLALTTALPTPTGWTTMGEVAVGDVLLDDAGRSCRVTAISPVKMGDSYEVLFSDGASIVADSEHLWLTESYVERKRRRLGSVRTTAEIARTLIVRDKQPARNHAVRNALPLDLPPADLSVDPYLLGVWLGDGSSAAATITASADDIDEVADLVRATGSEVRIHKEQMDRAPHFGVLGLKGRLRRLGLLGAKGVPAVYLRGSLDQRRALLAGLLDTDGTVARHAGPSVQFDNKNERLADAVYELVVSLGMKATRSKKRATLRGVDHGVCHRVSFVPTIQVFRLTRKASLLHFDAAQQARRVRRYVAAVRPVASVPMRCLAVDSPSRLYLAGEAMVPTHNTNLLSVLLEEMSAARLRWCAIDPVGVLWGLRHSIDGSGPGVECLILGGVHGDIDIEPTGGAVVADLVCDEDVDVLIDCSRDRNGQMWSSGQRVRFLTDLALRLFQRQGSLVNGRRRPPRFVALDEAARYIPQMIPPGNKELPFCVGAWEQLVEEGRNVGLGVGLFTQRSARINKSVAELADLMLALRTTGPNSIAAIIDWLGEHVPKSDQRTMIEQVRKLPVGTALAVSPGWLQHEGVVALRARRTFDSSATPKPGETPRRVSGKGAVVDLDAYRTRMAETIERADASDPKLLRRRLDNAETLLRLAREALVGTGYFTEDEIGPDIGPRITELWSALNDRPAELPEPVEVPVLSEDLLIRLEDALQPVASVLSEVSERLTWETKVNADTIEFTRRARRDVPGTGPAGHDPDPVAPRKPRTPQRPDPPSGREPHRPPVPRVAPTSAPGDDLVLSKSQARILDALAWFASVRIAAPTRGQIAFQSGVSPKGSGFEKNLSTLRTRGLVDYPYPNRVGLTDAGRAATTPPAAPATSEALQQAIMARVSGPQRTILTAILDVYPNQLHREELADRVGVSPRGSGYEKNLSTLRSLGLLDYPAQGYVAGTEMLFID